MKVPDLLYHGTSLRAAARIIKMGRIILPRVGNRHISTSADKAVAWEWAAIQSASDDPRLGGKAGANYEASLQSKGAVFVISAADLVARSVRIRPFSDDCYGDGACDWEKEWAVLAPIPDACFVNVLYDEAVMPSIFASENWRANTFKAPTVA